MATSPRIESDVTEPVLRPAAEALRSLAHCVGILAAGLVTGFLARGIGGGILVDGVALGIPAALLAGGAFLAYRALHARGPVHPGGSAPAP